MDQDDLLERRCMMFMTLLLLAYVAMVVLTAGMGLQEIFGFTKDYLLVVASSAVAFAFIALVGQVFAVHGLRPQGSLFGLLIQAAGVAWRQGMAQRFAWAASSFGVLIAFFGLFKQRVIGALPFTHDRLFADLDRLLFFGRDPARWLYDLIGSPETTLWLNRIYHPWFFPMMFVIFCVAVQGDQRLRLRYYFSFFCVWVLLGSCMALLFPAAGPCFFADYVSSGNEFGYVHDVLTGHQQSLGASVSALTYQGLLRTAYEQNVLMFGAGISAMPSVHNALAVLFALAMFQVRTWLGVLASVYAVVIAVASVYLGWHYAIDAIVAAVGALLIWQASGWLADRLRLGQRRDAGAGQTAGSMILPASDPDADR